ncbi:hypothetical protein O7614_26590 [Micromonospora sp. WMMD961]|uniref:hypothetical protein n=1 Tax=Micromonospora sp. WMMD961 TaxID=3016100 RepID=UPI002415B88E|nr:hypothetical protein [Micromonospora sp. WMMD961]MDG4783233.1 hypothetical protein [Micromonospora sp. WMMD961]
MSHQQITTPTAKRQETPDGLAVLVQDDENFAYYGDLLPDSGAWHVTWLYDIAAREGLVRVHEHPVEIVERSARYWFAPSTMEAA